MAQEFVKTANTQLLYHFENNANDDSGNGRNGTVVGATYVDGMFGKGLQFATTGKYVDCGFNTMYTEFTILAWIKPSSYPAGGTGEIVSKRSLSATAPTDFPFAFLIDNNGKLNSLASLGNDYVADSSLVSAAAIPTTSFSLVALVIKNNVKLAQFLNGVYQENAIAFSISTNTRNYFIGRQSFVNVTEYGFPGIIDEVVIENRAWTQAELNAYYLNNGKFFQIF